MAAALRKSLCVVRLRRGWPGRNRLWRLRRARDLRDRSRGRHPLQADRARHPGSARAEDPSAAEEPRRMRRVAALLLLAFAGLAFGQASEVVNPDAAVEARLKSLAEEL